MISMKLKFKVQNFDRTIIKRNWKKINRGPLTKSGNFVKVIAKRSIRRGKKGGKPSPIGRPPKARKGKGKGTPFKLIFSVPRIGGTSVIVGMVGFGGRSAVPGMHEHSGRARRSVIVKTAAGRHKKTGRFTKAKTAGRWVTRGGKHKFIPKIVTKMASYPPRPFMFPALIKARPKLPKFWLNSLPRG